MKTYKKLYENLCSYDNLLLAFKKARKRKSKKEYVREFEKDLEENLLLLRVELLLHAYKPKPLETFILRDPKTRKISKSDFHDRVVHHALCNILEPIFDKLFIYDSYANRKGKGTLKALQRFDYFKRKVTRNNTRKGFVLKADVYHYFENVNHNILINIIKRKIKDERIIWMIKQILNNFASQEQGRGMPLGNLTSQFFANIYLNELDQFVKHKLKAKCYIRYVDDFVILDKNVKKLEVFKSKINTFLESIKLKLHPEKSVIKNILSGISFLGFRVFYYHKLLKNKNSARVRRKIIRFKKMFGKNKIGYDTIYASMEGWAAHAKGGNTYKLRTQVINLFQTFFLGCIASVEIQRWIRKAQIIPYAIGAGK